MWEGATINSIISSLFHCLILFVCPLVANSNCCQSSKGKLGNLSQITIAVFFFCISPSPPHSSVIKINASNKVITQCLSMLRNFITMLNRLLRLWAYPGSRGVDYIGVIVKPTQCLRIRCAPLFPFFSGLVFARLIERLGVHTHTHTPGVRARYSASSSNRNTCDKNGLVAFE